METKYSAKINEGLEGKMDEATFKAWLVEQPILELSGIFREIKETIKERRTKEDYATLDRASVAESIIRFEDTILDIKIKKELNTTQKEPFEARIEEEKDYFSSNRQFIIEGVLADDDDIVYQKQLANKLIDLEKLLNRYDPENWKAILEML